MNAEYYDIIFKRKSFHFFRDTGNESLSREELEDIQKAYSGFEALYPGIRTAMRIVPASSVNVGRDAEYCLLLYSEKKDNYLMNMGYIGEQLDLFLVKRDIGSLWFGIGKADEEEYDGLSYVIMIAVRKVSDRSKYRKDMFRAKRKALSEIWSGDTLGIGEIARFAPSACNSQPWYVVNEDGLLTVFRYKKPGKRGIMPAAAVAYYNRIDIGIFLCFLEICMAEKGICFERRLFVDGAGGEAEYSRVAEYSLGGPL